MILSSLIASIIHRGELVLEGGLTASFRIKDGRYFVNLQARIDLTPFFARDVSLGFEEEAGRTSENHSSVQFHPMSKQARASLDEGERRLVGWSLTTSMESGTSARPMQIARADEGGILIGNLGGEPREMGWVWDTSYSDPWLKLLKPYARHH